MTARRLSRPESAIKEVPGYGRFRFIYKYDVPWLAGSSNHINPETGNPDIYVQRGTDTDKHINGTTYDFDLPLAVHEFEERKSKLPPAAAHNFATGKEDKWVDKHWPELPPSVYQKHWRSDIKRAADIARRGHVTVPPDIVVKEYEHPHNPLERKMYEEIFGKAA